MGQQGNRRRTPTACPDGRDGGRVRFAGGFLWPPLALLVALAALSGACLTDETLRIECRNDRECRGVGRCIDRVCTTGTAVSRDCASNQTRCGDECVDTSRSSAHCGRCFEPCVAGPEQSAVCVDSACQRSCSDGFFDVDPDAPGCEYRCEPTSPSTEVCDGVDNDCDGRVDAQDPDLSAPRCPNQNGVCRDSRRACVEGELRECDASTYRAFAGDDWEQVELACDQIDNDCDGAADEHCCRINQEPYTLVPTGGEAWGPVVLGILDATDGPHLIVVDTVLGELNTFRLGRTTGIELVATEPIRICPAFMLSDAIFSSGRRLVVAACSESRSAVSAFPLAEVEPRGYVRTEPGTYVRGMDASAAADALYVVADVLDPDGRRSAQLVVDRDGEVLVPDYAPPVPSYEAASIAAADDGAHLVFASRDEGAVWLQRLDRDGAAVSFARPIVEGADWSDGPHPLATDVIRRDDRLLVAHPGEGGALTLTSVSSDARPSTLSVFDGVRATRVELRDRRPEPTALFALTDDALRAWTLDDSGEAVRSWSLPLNATTREDIAGTLPARIAVHTDGDVLFVAYASPSDASGERDGTFVHRLGPDSEPLCR